MKTFRVTDYDVANEPSDVEANTLNRLQAKTPINCTGQTTAEPDALLPRQL